MTGPTHGERNAGLRMLAVGILFGIGITLAFFGIVWLPLSAIGLALVIAIRHLGSGGRILDFESWFQGATGESQVWRALEELEPLGYRTLHDIDTGHGNVDHVVVGPTGVFAVETKNRGGRVTTTAGDLRVNGFAVRDASQAVRGAIWVRDRAQVRFVDAVLVYPSAKVDGDVVRLRSVTVVPLARLNAEITSQRRALPVEEIDRIERALTA
jgi:hypothetical protein